MGDRNSGIRSEAFADATAVRLFDQTPPDVAADIWQRAGLFDLPQTKQQQDAQRNQGGFRVDDTNPGATQPKYDKVPHDQDARIISPILRTLSPAAEGLYRLYLKTYTDRSGENKVPGTVQIAEMHPGVKDRVKTMDLLSDGEMMEPSRGGRMLHPDGRKRPGDFYAVLSDAQNDPVNVIEYTSGKDGPKFLQQWIFNNEINDQAGLQRTTISHFVNENQPVFRPAQQQGVVADVFAGKTEYVYSKEGKMLSATKFNALQQPEVVVDYRGPKPTMQLRDPNSGQLKEAPFNSQQLTKLAFRNLYLGA
jgi:hypothetical protein